MNTAEPNVEIEVRATTPEGSPVRILLDDDSDPSEVVAGLERANATNVELWRNRKVWPV